MLPWLWPFHLVPWSALVVSVCRLDQEPFQDTRRNTVRWSGAQAPGAYRPKPTPRTAFGQCRNLSGPPGCQRAGKSSLIALQAGTEAH